MSSEIHDETLQEENTMTTKTMTKSATISSALSAAERYEIDGGNPPDGRRVVRDERMTLLSRSQRGVATPADAAELRRVIAMWKGVPR